jgi:hypothetical protein
MPEDGLLEQYGLSNRGKRRWRNRWKSMSKPERIDYARRHGKLIEYALESGDYISKDDVTADEWAEIERVRNSPEAATTIRAKRQAALDKRAIAWRTQFEMECEEEWGRCICGCVNVGPDECENPDCLTQTTEELDDYYDDEDEFDGEL